MISNLTVLSIGSIKSRISGSSALNIQKHMSIKLHAVKVVHTDKNCQMFCM